MATLTLDTGRPRSLLDKLVEERAAPERATPDATAPRGAVAERPVSAAGGSVAERPASSAGAPRGASAASGATLDALVARSWSTLRVTRAASCLLCGGEVEPRYGSGPHPVGGTCRSCGTEIA